MEIYEYKVITYFDWEESTRPEIRIDGNHISLFINDEFVFEINCSTKEDVCATLNDYAQLFLKASESLTGKTNE